MQAASLANANWNFPGKHAASSQLWRVQSFLNSAVLRLCKIGYCPLIESFGTNFVTVYTVLKHAQMVSDSLEQNNAVITSEVAIFIQAKEIQLKFSVEF